MTDYDQTDIPAAYDRARDHGPEIVDLWMRAVAEGVGRDAVCAVVVLTGLNGALVGLASVR